MKRILLTFICLATTSMSPSLRGQVGNSTQASQERQLLERMIAACTNLKSASQVFKSTERMDDGRYYDSEMVIKFEASPKKVYIYCINPNAGAECLWVEGEHKNKVVVNPNGFPYITLRLDMHNELLRQDTHHTIGEIGFDYIVSMMRHYTRNFGNNFYGMLSIVDTLTWDKRRCIHLRFDYKDFACNPYTVKPGETITSISQRYHLNDYMVLRRNPGLKDYDGCKPGQVIQLPNFYNRRVEFYVDMNSWLPLVQMVYDEIGLFERYELRSFVENPEFHPSEFTTAYEAYGF